MSAEQRGQALDAARREARLGEAMARDRRAEASDPSPGDGSEHRAGQAARRRAHCSGQEEGEGEKKARRDDDGDFVARVPKAKIRGLIGARVEFRFSRSLRPAASRYFAQSVSRDSAFAGSSGMHATGQTCTHCGSSKWPTHSVQRAGSMT